MISLAKTFYDRRMRRMLTDMTFFFHASPLMAAVERGPPRFSPYHGGSGYTRTSYYGRGGTRPSNVPTLTMKGRVAPRPPTMVAVERDPPRFPYLPWRVRLHPDLPQWPRWNAALQFHLLVHLIIERNIGIRIFASTQLNGGSGMLIEYTGNGVWNTVSPIHVFA